MPVYAATRAALIGFTAKNPRVTGIRSQRHRAAFAQRPITARFDGNLAPLRDQIVIASPLSTIVARSIEPYGDRIRIRDKPAGAFPSERG